MIDDGVVSQVLHTCRFYGMHNAKDDQRVFCRKIMPVKAVGDDARITGLGSIRLALERRV